MKHVNFAFLLIAAAIGIQAATDGPYLDTMIDSSGHDVGVSDDRSSGGGMLASDSSMVTNRAESDSNK